MKIGISVNICFLRWKYRRDCSCIIVGYIYYVNHVLTTSALGFSAPLALERAIGKNTAIGKSHWPTKNSFVFALGQREIVLFLWVANGR